MNIAKHMTLTGLAIAATVALGAGNALAQHDPSDPQVNVSGATLFKSFFTAPGSTNDYIDVDGDSYSGNLGSPNYSDQLVKSWTDFTTTPSFSTYDGYMYVNYRGVGSGNGLAEMLNHQAVLKASTTAQSWYPASRTGASTNSSSAYSNGGVTYANVPTNLPSDGGWTNRQQFSNGATVTGPGTYTHNGSGSPIAQSGVDIGVMDVPTTWFITQSGTGNWQANPASTGYGNNEIGSWDLGRSNKLKSLTRTLSSSDGTASEDVTFNLNTSSPDSKTVFDSQITFVPVGVIANTGTGLAQAKFSEMQTLFTTGRMANGENLKAATRDSGSGTRNSAMNSLGIDPSWGRGENMGDKVGDYEPTYLGPNHQVSNLGGSSLMQTAVSVDRLAVGYQGVETCESKQSKGAVDHVALWKDVGPADDQNNTYVLPGVNNIVDNGGADGWKMGGNETMATVGDPTQTDSSAPDYMQNQAAAAYINNITQSIAGFSGAPTSSDNYYMPGEYLAQSFFLTEALDSTPGALNGLDWEDQSASRNATLAAYIKANNTLSVHASGDAGWESQTPRRDALASGTYADGDDGTNGYNYYMDTAGNTGTLQEKTSVLSARNQIQGDFNYDGTRNIDDLATIIACAQYAGSGSQTNGILRWAYDDNVARGIAQGEGVMPHIIGDFDGNGDFDTEDIRYFCDGLAIQTNVTDAQYGLIDKAAAYSAADAAGVFSTTKANGTYINGDTMYDIAGSDITTVLLGATPGANPSGHDGRIDGYDISYVQRILNGQIAVLCGLSASSADYDGDGVLEWSSVDEAIFMDLSADFDGDLDNDASDLQALFGALGTGYGDANIDGTVDLLDLGAVGDNWKQAGTYWANGDFNGDAAVDLLDLGIVGDNWKSSYGSVGVTVTPEPATMSLLGLGGLGMLIRRRRRS